MDVVEVVVSPGQFIEIRRVCDQRRDGTISFEEFVYQLWLCGLPVDEMRHRQTALKVDWGWNDRAPLALDPTPSNDAKSESRPENI